MYGKASSLKLCAPLQVQGTHPGRTPPCCTARCGPGLASGKTVACGQGNHEANAWKRRDSCMARDISHTLHKWGKAILFAVHTIPKGDTLGSFGFFLSFVTDSWGISITGEWFCNYLTITTIYGDIFTLISCMTCGNIGDNYIIQSIWHIYMCIQFTQSSDYICDYIHL